jgi:hypothetical protein
MHSVEGRAERRNGPVRGIRSSHQVFSSGHGAWRWLLEAHGQHWRSQERGPDDLELRRRGMRCEM